MKNFVLVLFFSFLASYTFSQTDGFTYQAVIIDENAQEIPGMDISGNYLIETNVSLLFTIVNANDQIEFQEIHNTQTDAYGMVNLVIGTGETTILSNAEFDEIEWDGTPKSLEVGLRFDSGEFEDFSEQELYFVPYAFHRNITATGSLIVDGPTTLNSELTVENGAGTHLTGDLIVNGNSNLEGDLQVNGNTNIDGDLSANTLEVANETVLNGTLVVEGESTFNSIAAFNDVLNANGALNVNNGAPTYLSGNLTVAGSTEFTGPVGFEDISVSGNSDLEGDLTVGGSSELNGQVTISVDVSSNGGQSTYDAYPLRVEGSNQGIAVKVNGGEQESKNFMTFYNGYNSTVGCIEGQTLSELHGSFRYIWDYAFSVVELIFIAAEGVATGSQLDWPESYVMGGGYAAVSAQWIESLVEMENQVGVSFTSGGADYAEWIPKENLKDVFNPGEVVGIKAGKISRNTLDADHVLAISTNPIVMGNMPKQGEEANYGRVGFLGQVPVRVIGKVALGDYVVASGNNDGLAVAYNKKKLPTHLYSQIIGIAWEASEKMGMSTVNTAIGLTANDLTDKVVALEDELATLRHDVEMLKASLLGQRPENKTVKEENLESQPENTPNYLESAIAISEINAEISQADWDEWMSKNSYLLTERMALVREHFISQGIDYQQYEEVAFLVDTPIDALNAMHDGTFMPTLWQAMEKRFAGSKK